LAPVVVNLLELDREWCFDEVYEDLTPLF